MSTDQANHMLIKSFKKLWNLPFALQFQTDGDFAFVKI